MHANRRPTDRPGTVGREPGRRHTSTAAVLRGPRASIPLKPLEQVPCPSFLPLSPLFLLPLLSLSLFFAHFPFFFGKREGFSLNLATGWLEN